VQGPHLQFSIYLPDHTADAPGLCISCLQAGTVSIHTDATLNEVPATDKHQRKKTARRQKRLSMGQELDIAESLNARVQKGSGALPWAKGDVLKSGVFRVEAKYTEAKSYSVKLEDLEKIQGECQGAEFPVFVIDFKQQGKTRERVALIPFNILETLLNGPKQHQ
jgi:hypothetical protein